MLRVLTEGLDRVCSVQQMASQIKKNNSLETMGDSSWRSSRPATLLAAGLLVFGQSMAFADDDTAAIHEQRAPAATAYEDAYERYKTHADNGAWSAAEAAARLALELGRQRFGVEHKNTAALTYNLGTTLQRQNQYADAKKVLKEALKLYEANYGKKSSELVILLMDLGEVTAKWGDPSVQKHYFNRALRLLQAEYGKRSETYAKAQVRAGVSILHGSQSKSAGPYLTQGYKSLLDLHGRQHPLTGEAAFFLGKYKMSAGRYAAAEPYLLSAIDGLANPDKPSNQYELTAHAFLVKVYEELDQSEKATQHCLAIGRTTPWSEDQDYLPVYKRAPRYPFSAIEARRSGYVVVRFDVDESGFVSEPLVVESTHSVFEKSAIKAAANFRYAPRFADGKPVATRGVLHKITFKFVD